MALGKAVRERVYQKFGGRCAYCGKPMEYKSMQVDHYMPQCRERFYSNRFGGEPDDGLPALQSLQAGPHTQKIL